MGIRIPTENITSESFVVLWDEVMDIFTITYNVTWYNESGIIGMVTVNSPPYTVTGLTANTSYNVTVVAINTCCGAGPVSDVVTMTNMREPTPPPSPTPGNVTVYSCYKYNQLHVNQQTIKYMHTHACTHTRTHTHKHKHTHYHLKSIYIYHIRK